jgi:hypothetical protein
MEQHLRVALLPAEVVGREPDSGRALLADLQHGRVDVAAAETKQREKLTICLFFKYSLKKIFNSL